MTSGFEFHGLRDEIYDFALEMAIRHGLHIALLYDRGQRETEVISPERFSLAPKVHDGLGWICFTANRPVVLGVSQDFDFIKANPDRLSFRIGELCGTRLDLSMLQYPTSAPGSHTWRGVSANFKKRLENGGWIYWPNHHAKRLANRAYFTAGALGMYASRSLTLWGAGTETGAYARNSYVYVPGADGNDPILAGAQEA